MESTSEIEFYNAEGLGQEGRSEQHLGSAPQRHGDQEWGRRNERQGQLLGT